MNKKVTVMVALAAVVCGGVCEARPGGHGGFGGGPRPMMHGPMHHPAPVHHHHHHGSVWGRGGSNFWPGFIGGVVGGAIVNTRPVYTPSPVVVTPSPVVVTPTPVVTPAPVVVAPTPVVTPSVSVQNVWVEGAYVDQVQANGTVVRVWQPGHYEQRQVTY